MAIDILDAVESLDKKLLTPLRSYQRAGIAYILKKQCRGIIADEMGLGKTLQAIGVMLASPEIKRVLIVCPSMVKAVWQFQLDAHAALSAEIIYGTKPYSVNQNIVIINYDILPDWHRHLLKLKFDMIIFDEVHYIKNKTAQRTKAALYLGKRIPYILALSGTPITSRPMEFYPLLNLLHPEVFRSKLRFGLRYCGAKHNGFAWEYKGASNSQELHRILRGLCMIRRRKDMVLKELPAKERILVPIPLTKSGRADYDKAMHDTAEWLHTHGKLNKNALIAIAKFEYLKQAAVLGKMINVIKWLEEYLGSCDQKLVVYATHTNTLNVLHEHFKNSVVLDGRCSQKGKQEALNKFIHDGSVRLLLGNLKVAGTGIDGLQKVTNATCFVELGWTPGIMSQAEDRVHRIGQAHDCVLAYYLIAQDTVEEDIANLLSKKQKVLNMVLDGRKVADEELLSQLLQQWRKK